MQLLRKNARSAGNQEKKRRKEIRIPSVFCGNTNGVPKKFLEQIARLFSRELGLTRPRRQLRNYSVYWEEFHLLFERAWFVLFFLFPNYYYYFPSSLLLARNFSQILIIIVIIIFLDFLPPCLVLFVPLVTALFVVDLMYNYLGVSTRHNLIVLPD